MRKRGGGGVQMAVVDPYEAAFFAFVVFWPPFYLCPASYKRGLRNNLWLITRVCFLVIIPGLTVVLQYVYVESCTFSYADTIYNP